MNISPLALPTSGIVNNWEVENFDDGHLYEIVASDKICPDVVNRPNYNLAYRDIIIQNKINETLDELYASGVVDYNTEIETVSTFTAETTKDLVLGITKDWTNLHRGKLFIYDTVDPTQVLSGSGTLKFFDGSLRTSNDISYDQDIALHQINLSSDITIGDSVISVVDASSFSAKDLICIYDGTNRMFTRIVSISTNDITISEVAAYGFASASTGVSYCETFGGFTVIDNGGAGSTYPTIEFDSAFTGGVELDVIVQTKGKSLQSRGYNNVLIGDQVKTLSTSDALHGLQISGDLTIATTSATASPITVTLYNCDIVGDIIGIPDPVNSFDINIDLQNTNYTGSATNVTLV